MIKCISRNSSHQEIESSAEELNYLYAIVQGRVIENFATDKYR